MLLCGIVFRANFLGNRTKPIIIILSAVKNKTILVGIAVYNQNKLTQERIQTKKRPKSCLRIKIVICNNKTPVLFVFKLSWLTKIKSEIGLIEMRCDDNSTK